MLESLGYRADLAENGLAAVEAVQQRDYDLLLMDMQMPVMDGLEATRRIRALLGRPQPLIFAMSASVLDRERQACLDAGMERHLAKPFRRHELESLLQEVVASLDRRAAPPTPAAAASPSARAVVDLSPLVADLGEDGVAELIAEMVSAAAANLDALREAQRGGDALQLVRASQALEVHCSMVGATALAQDCAELRRLAESDPRQVGKLLESVSAGYAQLIEQLREWRG